MTSSLLPEEAEKLNDLFRRIGEMETAYQRQQEQLRQFHDDAQGLVSGLRAEFTLHQQASTSLQAQVEEVRRLAESGGVRRDVEGLLDSKLLEKPRLNHYNWCSLVSSGCS